MDYYKYLDADTVKIKITNCLIHSHDQESLLHKKCEVLELSEISSLQYVHMGS